MSSAPSSQRSVNAAVRLRGSVERLQAAVYDGLLDVLDAIDDLTSALQDAPPSPAAQPATQPLVDKRQAARILGLSSSTLDSLIAAGEISYVGIPSAKGDREIKRFSADALREFQERHSRSAPT